MSVFGAAQASFYQRVRSKTYRFGHTPVEGRSDGTRGEPQNSPCAAPEGQQKTSETLHSIKGRADTPYIMNRAAHVFPIQFPVLYYPSLVPRPPSEKSRKGLATRMAMRCPRGLYTRANQIAEIIYVTFNRGCANSSVYGDHHGVQLTRQSKFPEVE